MNYYNFNPAQMQIFVKDDMKTWVKRAS